MKLKDIEGRVRKRAARVVRTLVDIDLRGETGNMVLGEAIREAAAFMARRSFQAGRTVK